MPDEAPENTFSGAFFVGQGGGRLLDLDRTGGFGPCVSGGSGIPSSGAAGGRRCGGATLEAPATLYGRPPPPKADTADDATRNIKESYLYKWNSIRKETCRRKKKDEGHAQNIR